MDDLTKRFVSAYNKIDKFLRHSHNANTREPFATLVHEVSKKNRTVRHFATVLKDYGDLRNAIMHGMTDEPLATPHSHTVEGIERVLEELVAPPKLVSILEAKAVTCSPEEEIGVVASRMLAADFSQLPVVCDSHLVDLLSTDTIARWFAAHVEEGGGMLEEESVEKVLEHAEHRAKSQPTYKVVNRDATVFDALGLFSDAETNGMPLYAIIVTNSGSKHETPLRVVTAYDIPKLLSFVRYES